MSFYRVGTPPFPFPGGLRRIRDPIPVLDLAIRVQDTSTCTRTRTRTVRVLEGPTELRLKIITDSTAVQHACIGFVVNKRSSVAVVSVVPNTMIYFLNFRPCHNLSAGSNSRTRECASILVA
jgi:hypothetical protein